MKILIVGAHRNGLALLRALAGHAHRCIIVDHSPTRPGLHSRYADRHDVVPDPVVDQDGFVDAVRKIGREEYEPGHKTLLFPTNDAHVNGLANSWHLLEEYFSAGFETDLQILQDCLLKTRMYQAAEAAGIPLPNCLYSPARLVDLGVLSFPVVIKPDNANMKACVDAGIRRLYVCHEQEEAGDALEKLNNVGVPFVVQEYIPGGDDCLFTVGAYSLQGEMQACFTGRKLRQFPVTLGECSYGQAVSCEEISKLAQKFLKKLQFTGICQIEFKYNNGKYYLMEINPRSWSWVGLACYCGVNLPEIAVSILTQGSREQYVKQSNFSATWHYFYPDLLHNVIKNKNISFRQFLKDAASANAHAFWDRRDPVPAFVHIYTLVLRFTYWMRAQLKSLIVS